MKTANLNFSFKFCPICFLTKGAESNEKRLVIGENQCSPYFFKKSSPEQQGEGVVAACGEEQVLPGAGAGALPRVRARRAERQPLQGGRGEELPQDARRLRRVLRLRGGALLQEQREGLVGRDSRQDVRTFSEHVQHLLIY